MIDYDNYRNQIPEGYEMFFALPDGSCKTLDELIASATDRRATEPSAGTRSFVPGVEFPEDDAMSAAPGATGAAPGAVSGLSLDDTGVIRLIAAHELDEARIANRRMRIDQAKLGFGGERSSVPQKAPQKTPEPRIDLNCDPRPAPKTAVEQTREAPLGSGQTFGNQQPIETPVTQPPVAGAPVVGGGKTAQEVLDGLPSRLPQSGNLPLVAFGKMIDGLDRIAFDGETAVGLIGVGLVVALGFAGIAGYHMFKGGSPEAAAGVKTPAAVALASPSPPAVRQTGTKGTRAQEDAKAPPVAKKPTAKPTLPPAFQLPPSGYRIPLGEYRVQGSSLVQVHDSGGWFPNPKRSAAQKAQAQQYGLGYDCKETVSALLTAPDVMTVKEDNKGVSDVTVDESKIVFKVVRQQSAAKAGSKAASCVHPTAERVATDTKKSLKRLGVSKHQAQQINADIYRHGTSKFSKPYLHEMAVLSRVAILQSLDGQIGSQLGDIIKKTLTDKVGKANGLEFDFTGTMPKLTPTYIHGQGLRPQGGSSLQFSGYKARLPGGYEAGTVTAVNQGAQ